MDVRIKHYHNNFQSMADSCTLNGVIMYYFLGFPTNVYRMNDFDNIYVNYPCLKPKDGLC